MANTKIAVLDIETPNKRNDSICSIGMVIIDEELNEKEIYYLVNPETNFDEKNIELHGITQDDVADAMTFPEVWEIIKDYFTSCLLIGHKIIFDLSCIRKLLERYNIESTPTYYIDTFTLAQKYVKCTIDCKLTTLCEMFDIDLTNHHNALEDSQATADLFFSLVNAFDVKLNEFIRMYDFSENPCKTSKRNRSSSSEFSAKTKYLQELQGVLLGVTSDNELNDKEIYAIKKWLDMHLKLKGNFPFDRIYKSLEVVLEDNVITETERTELLELFESIINPVKDNEICNCKIDIEGKKICLTGEFTCMSRDDFYCFLEQHGAIIKNGVVKDLAYLIVGGEGSSQWSQGNYGNKVKKANEYNEKGCEIIIIREDNFMSSFET